MSNANTPAMMAQSMAESLLRENGALKEQHNSLLDAYRKNMQLVSDLQEQNALLTVQVQEGWKWVPVEPTADMKNAGIAYFREHKDDIFNSATHYQEMLAAAPALPQQVKSE